MNQMKAGTDGESWPGKQRHGNEGSTSMRMSLNASSQITRDAWQRRLEMYCTYCTYVSYNPANSPESHPTRITSNAANQ